MIMIVLIIDAVIYDTGVCEEKVLRRRPARTMVAIFCPFGLFCEIGISLLSLQKQPKTAPHLFQRGVEYGKYENMIV